VIEERRGILPRKSSARNSVLSVGAIADVAVLRVETGKYGFVDHFGARLDGTKR